MIISNKLKLYNIGIVKLSSRRYNIKKAELYTVLFLLKFYLFEFQ